MRGLLLVALGIGAAVMLVIGLIGAFAVHESTETVDDLSQELGPAQVSNSEFMQAMLDAETELRAYLISGEQQQLVDHRAALAQVPLASEVAVGVRRGSTRRWPILVAQQEQAGRGVGQ